MLDVFVVRFLRPAVQVGVEPLVGVPTGKKANFGDLSLMIVSEFTLFASALLLRREAYRDDP